MAALMVQMMTAGGAGARGERVDERRDTAAAEDLGKNLKALKNEVASLRAQYQQARERRRLEAEQRKRESGEWTHEPQAPATPAAGRTAVAPGGGSPPAR
ncbi:hypothetical protein LY474_33665 [Myxococcus stipitatus]|uniref:hypothetical protein n=1 Tax=Myxococcus stipitatus TaxID=83455 RepID=UPI001F1928E6|nr:hypothetical protein [Myxococcus stipitatus]MCE9672765.1 hypothetical protein [Myxococcus stipitatus]